MGTGVVVPAPRIPIAIPKRKSVAAKGKEKLTAPTTPEISEIGGATPFPSAFGVHSKARENPQAPVVEQPKGGPSRPKPKKIEVINLSSDDEGEKKKETAVEKEGPEPEHEEEEEDLEEAPASLSLLSPPTSPSKRNDGAYDDPHY
ncbi:hypothetical protein PIB30_013871 [Stylosanthes scabra]|uniref:Uncharacterized protein n=1 Tax=Stylosanthes scabra TaxID=79078 RepID=A0ABU6U5W9_9FABA|nr:hypothetical protein [Stylosanthes scabra]